jgi:hypothetical protein
MELPAALAPWGSYLEVFPRELAVALAPIIQRLDRAIGPLRSASASGSGDPEGFDGLARRGSYERLLISEWLLADEVPDEFLRRAAMGEQAFLRIARSEPAGGRLSLALFDAGPSQLGFPRLAHIAALLVLARRAAAGNSKFAWGILQDPSGELETSTDPAAIGRLLRSRTCREPGEVEAHQWEARLTEMARSPTPPEDFWVVGGPRAERWSRAGAAFLRLEEPAEIGVRELSAVTRDSGRLQRVTLPLPEEPTCVRLLRDPFAQSTTAPAMGGDLVPRSNLVWGYGGTKLLARCGSASIVSYPVPNSPSAGVGRARVYRTEADRWIIAAGRYRKAMVAVTAAIAGGPMQLHALGTRQAAHFEGVDLPPTAAVNLQRPLPELGYIGLFAWGRSLWADLFENICLFTSHEDGDVTPPYQFVAGDISGAGPLGGGLVYASSNGCITALSADRTTTVREPGGVGPFGRVFFGWGGRAANPQFGLCAVEQADGTYQVLDATGVRILAPPGERRVVGVVVFDGTNPNLVFLEPHGRQITVMGASTVMSLPPTSAEITHVSVSPYGPVIAYCTSESEVCVYSLTHRALLYHLTPGPNPGGGNA